MKALTLLFIYILGTQAHAGLKTPDITISDASLAYFESEKCSISRYGIVCTQNGHEMFQIRDVKQPTQIVVPDDGLSFCALTSDGVRCFRNQGKEVETPKLKNPRQITGDRGLYCALDDQGVQCWQYSNTHGKSFSMVPTRGWKNPRMISLWAYQLCALDDEGASCWDTYRGDSLFTEFLKKVKNPTRIAGANDAICVRDEGGDRCMTNRNRSYNYQLEPIAQFFKDPHFKRDWEAFDPRLVVSKQNPEFNLDQIGAFTDLLAKVTPPGRARFFNTVRASVVPIKFEHFRFEDQGRYLLLRLMEPAILGYNSPYFAEKLIPAYRKSLASIEQELGIQNISRIERSERYREIALRTMQAALPILVDFMDFNQRAEVEHLARLVGQAILSAQNVPALTQALDKADPTLISLEQNPKSANLVQVIRLAAEWVKGS